MEKGQENYFTRDRRERSRADAIVCLGVSNWNNTEFVTFVKVQLIAYNNRVCACVVSFLCYAIIFQCVACSISYLSISRCCRRHKLVLYSFMQTHHARRCSRWRRGPQRQSRTSETIFSFISGRSEIPRPFSVWEICFFFLPHSCSRPKMLICHLSTANASNDLSYF